MLKHSRQPTATEQTVSSATGQEQRRWTSQQPTMPPRPSHHANGFASPGRYVASRAAQPPPLHVSMLNASKHSLSPTASVSPGTGGNQTKTTLTNLDQSRDDSLPLNFSNGPLSSSVFAPDRSLHNPHHTYR